MIYKESYIRTVHGHAQYVRFSVKAISIHVLKSFVSHYVISTPSATSHISGGDMFIGKGNTADNVPNLLDGAITEALVSRDREVF